MVFCRESQPGNGGLRLSDKRRTYRSIGPGEVDSRGSFIVFEGLDGAGTTTQLRRLRDVLSQLGLGVETTNEPTNGPIGAALRQTIEGRVHLDPVAQALAFAADRADHLFNTYNGVELSLKSGSWVLCDRYLMSGLAYQASSGIDLEWLRSANKFFMTPDATIFIDTPVDVCLRRINARGQHVELFHDSDRLGAVQRQYYHLLRDTSLTGELIHADGNRDVDAVAREIYTQILQRFPLLKTQNML